MVQSNINKSSHCEEFCLQKDEASQKNKYSWIAAFIPFYRKNIRQKRFSSLFTLNFLPRPAFTLPEVLITLGVIGVVAAMTIPTLMKVINDIQYKSAYKKAFAEAQNAYNIANKDDLFSGEAYADNNQVHKNNFRVFMEQFKVTKECTSNNNSECWNSVGEKYNNESYPNAGSWAFIDSSGRSWSMYYHGERILFVDTNGLQKPNQWGKDRFFLLVYNSDKTSFQVGIPSRVVPLIDNISWLCASTSGHKCYTEQNYFGTSWLYN